MSDHLNFGDTLRALLQAGLAEREV